MGTAWSEPTLIKIASGFESVTRARRAPRFLPTMPLPTGDDSLVRASLTLRAQRIKQLKEQLRSTSKRPRFI